MSDKLRWEKDGPRSWNLCLGGVFVDIWIALGNLGWWVYVAGERESGPFADADEAKAEGDRITRQGLAQELRQ